MTAPAAPALILGLDPGSRRTGWGFVEASGNRLRLVDQGCFSLPSRASVARRLAVLADGLAEALDQRLPHAAALESPFHGINSRSLIVLSQARGVLIAEVARRGVEVLEYSPAEVKSAVTGNGRAPKEQVARMVGLQLGADTTSWSADTTDALAVAICCARRFRMDRLAAFHGARK